MFHEPNRSDRSRSPCSGAMTASFGAGSGDIRLDNVVCDGTESNILECPHSAVVSSDCTHLDDAGVICQTGGRLKIALS